MGLLHVGARYYDPQVGRFISRDPVLSEHPYLYCEHEPVNRVDPAGDTAVALPGLLIPGVREVIIGASVVVIASIGVKKLAEKADDWADYIKERWKLKEHRREKHKAREEAKRKGGRPRYRQPHNIPDDEVPPDMLPPQKDFRDSGG